MSTTELLIERLRLMGLLYSAVRCTRDELDRIAASADAQARKGPRFAYRMTLVDRVRRA